MECFLVRISDRLFKFLDRGALLVLLEFKLEDLIEVDLLKVKGLGVSVELVGMLLPVHKLKFLKINLLFFKLKILDQLLAPL